MRSHSTLRARRGLPVVLLFFSLTPSGCRTGSPYTALYVFGDSYSDIGAGYVDGNGPTAVAYLARRLGIDMSHPNDPDAGGQSLDFAVSGARTGWGAGRVLPGGEMLGYGMENQVRDFVYGLETGALRFDPETTLFFLLGGLNDGPLPTDTTLAHLTSLVYSLRDAGARHFRLALLPTRIPAFRAVGERLNPSYVELVSHLRDQGIDISLSRWGPFFDEVHERPGAYGITDTTHACAGRAIHGQDTTPCESPEAHYYYHEGHPSTAVHRFVGDMLFRELTADGAGPPR